jgi:hypothetical protein
MIENNNNVNNRYILQETKYLKRRRRVKKTNLIKYCSALTNSHHQS